MKVGKKYDASAMASGRLAMWYIAARNVSAGPNPRQRASQALNRSFTSSA